MKTKHHDQPRICLRQVDALDQNDRGAPVINHTDAELVMLEALVGRRPPFLDSGAPPY